MKLLFGIVGSALSLWESKERRKYLDRWLKLKRSYYEEQNKTISDDAVLDDIRFDLELLAVAISTQVGEPNAKDLSK